MKLRLPKTRRYRVYLYILSFALILLAVDLIVIRIGRHITIGYDTTRITSPLRPDGTPDYIKYIDDAYSAGITADNNAGPLLIAAIGPKDLSSNMPAIYARLHMNPLPEEGNYVVPYRTFLTHPGQPLPPPGIDDDLLNICIRTPWAAADHPDVAAWLKVNAGPLELLQQATAKPRYYVPYVFSPLTTGRPILMYVNIISLGRYREFSGAALARSLLRAHEDDIVGARSDLLAALRLGSLIRQSRTVIEQLVGASIDHNAHIALQSLASSGKLTSAQAHQFLQDLDRLPTSIAFTDALELERHSSLDSLVFASLTGPAQAVQSFAPNRSTDRAGDYSYLMSLGNILRPLTPARFNKALRDVNADFDRMIAAARAPSFAENRRESSAIAKELESRFQPVIESAFPDPAQLIVAYLMPGIDRAGNYVYVTRADRDLSRLALALAAYHADHHAYPEALAALAPDYLPSIPQGPFIDAPFHYIPSPDGYLLYAVGVNMMDDHGHNALNKDPAFPSGDDLVVRTHP